MPETTARKAADFFISFSHDVGDPISNLKLQKLLYYAQAWHLALFDEPLFSERIEAWVHGPAVPPVYGQFKGWAWQPIAVPATAPKLTDLVRKHLHDVMRKYGTKTAYELETMTHREDPWRDARRGVAEGEPSNAVISHDSMRKYYRALLHGKTQTR